MSPPISVEEFDWESALPRPFLTACICSTGSTAHHFAYRKGVKPCFILLCYAVVSSSGYNGN